MTGQGSDPSALLRRSEPIQPYPAEASDEELAALAGVRPEDLVRFDMNTLGGGPLPTVVAALRSYDPARAVEYGDLAYRRLRSAISAVTGAPADRIIPGAGADELIRLTTTLSVGPGDTVVVAAPSFPMFEVEARIAGARVVTVRRRSPGRRQRVAELRAAVEEHGARLVWVCSPNNPTGDAFPVDDIRELVEGLPALVAVDAVYQEVAEESAGLPPEGLSLLPLQERAPNLLILRSLAKAYGLAGARVGYLVVAQALAAQFDAARLPLSVAGPSEAAALGALSDPEAARSRLRLIVAERERLAADLAGRGWEVLPSVANFLLVRPPDAASVAGRLLTAGLVVRSFPAGPLAGWLRITARAPADNDRLLAALGAGVDPGPASG